MHAYKFPEHEAEIARIARDLGFEQVSVSHEVSPLIKLVGRGDTTVVDAYLSPVLRRYVAQVSNELDVERTGARVMFMMSSGGLTAADLFREGCNPVWSCRWRRGARPHWRDGGFRAGHRL